MRLNYLTPDISPPPEALDPNIIRKSLAREAILNNLANVWEKDGSMPVMEPNEESLGKVSPSHPKYLDYKVVDSVFLSVKYDLESIVEKKLVTDVTDLNTIIASLNELSTLIVGRTENRKNLRAAGKSEREIREYMNRYGEDENDSLDRIALNTMVILKAAERSK